MGDIEWIENVEAKWDIHNIHLVAGKKFHLTRARFTASTANKVYWFSDETKPNKRSIKICWEDTNFSVECGKISRLRVIELLNNNDWILLDDVIIESTEEISTPHLSESDKIKNMIKEEIDGMEWIKDVKSNQDIAQEIADETKIKDDEIYPPFPFNFPPSYPFSLPRFPYLPPFFTKYCEEQYGLSEERLGTQYINDINDVWKRYKKLVKGKVNDHNNLNENDDMQWIRDVEPYVSFDNAEFNTKYGITIEDDYVFYNSIEDCGEEIDIDSIDHIQVSNRARLRFWEVYCSIGPGVVEWQGYKECLQIEFYDKDKGFLLSHWFAHNDVIQLHMI